MASYRPDEASRALRFESAQASLHGARPARTM